MPGVPATVVIPVHNRESTIERAVRSVLAQGGDLELIVVDDGSTDGTVAVLESIDDSRLTVLRQPHRGVSAARNHGAMASAGELLLFLDSDDEALPGWLAGFASAMASSIVAAASCSAELCEADGRRHVAEPESYDALLPGSSGLFLAGTFAIRRDVFAEAGGYAPELTYSENTELGLRVMALCRDRNLRIVTIPDVLVRVHRRAAQPLGEGELRRRMHAASYVLHHHRTALARQGSLDATYAAIVGVNAAKLGDAQAARRSLAESWRAAPRRPIAYARLAAVMVRPVRARVWPPIRRPADGTSGTRLPPPVLPRPLAARPTSSTIIPCYKGGDQLLRQVCAVASQLEDSDELLLVDNGPDPRDVARAAAAAPGARTRVVPAHAGHGQAYARNAGARDARGDVLLFVDQDDEVAPGYLSAMLEALRRDPLVFARVDVEALNDPLARSSRDMAQVSRLPDGLYPWGYACTMGIDARLFGAASGFDEELASAEDVDLCYRLQERFTVAPAFVEDAVLRYRYRTRRAETFQQARKYGRVAEAIHARHGAFGLTRPPLGQQARQAAGGLAWLAFGNRYQRRRGLWVVGRTVGRIEGRVRR